MASSLFPIDIPLPPFDPLHASTSFREATLTFLYINLQYLAVAYQVTHKTAVFPGTATPQLHTQIVFSSLTAHSSLTHVPVKS